MITMEELLALLVRQGGSDLHLSVGSPPRIRVDGVLLPVDCPSLDAGGHPTAGDQRPDAATRSPSSRGTSSSTAPSASTDQGRFRANVFYQRGTVGGGAARDPVRDRRPSRSSACRVAVCERICSLRAGLVLVTGATGSGKSTSLAAMIDYINETPPGSHRHDRGPDRVPAPHKSCLVNQREVGGDTQAFARALRSVLRQDPDVVLVGEMRDLETIEAALTLAETGHLTFGTLHTSDAVQTINRIVDVFPSHQQQQVRTQLSFTLQAVFCQQLLPVGHGPRPRARRRRS